MEPCFLTATQIASQLKAGTLTVTQIAESHLGRIKSRDADVQGWAFLDPNLVLQRAQELDNVPVGSRGPLHGIPVAVKDVIYTKGECRNWANLAHLSDMPTQHNSPIYAGDRPEIDAGEFSSFRMADMADYLKACIATLRALGALIFGKSVSCTLFVSSLTP
jgi:Asp-tRNA(Asn)/Glu-tRNA(Gln) amidotransferase A subunit family amidase